MPAAFDEHAETYELAVQRSIAGRRANARSTAGSSDPDAARRTAWSENASMKITVVGAGAMGSVYAALLAQGGNAVSVVDVDEEHVEAIRADGLRITGA